MLSAETRVATCLMVLWAPVLAGCSDPAEPNPGTVIVEVRPAGFTLTSLGDTVRLSAEAVDRHGHTIPGRTFNWSSSDSAIATVAPTGTVTAVRNGTVTITASSGEIQGSATVEVRQAVAVISVTPPSDTLYAGGDTTRLRADVTDARGHPVLDVVVLWSSSNLAVATIDVHGLVRATGDGHVVITARVGERAGVADIHVMLTVASVRIAPDTATVLRQGTTIFAAMVRDSVGTPMARTITWSSSDTAVARIEPTGTASARITGVARGTAAIVAETDGVRDTAQITVVVIELASVVAGANHSCGLTTTDAAYCWGRNREGQLGIGSTDAPEICQGIFPFSCSSMPLPVTGGLTFTQLVASLTGTTCGLTETGRAYCWGGFWVGPNTSFGATPVPIQTDLSFTTITAGAFHACGLTTDGSAYCWGSNNLGQLGTGDTQQSTVARAVAGGLAFRSLSAGSHHTCAIATDGTLYCWGDHHHGALGAGVVTELCDYFGQELLPCSRTPRRVAGDHTFESVSTYGSLHTCALTADGVAYCWGGNDFGQLGIGTAAGPEICPALHGDINCSIAPVLVDTELRFRTLSAGAWHVCAITFDDRMFCWGNNRHGQLGGGDVVHTICGGSPCATRPVPLPGELRFLFGGGGESHACAIAREGAYCWGQGISGALGNGGTPEISPPVRVAGQP